MTKSIQDNSRTDSFFAAHVKPYITPKNIASVVTVTALGALTAYQYLYDLPGMGSEYLVGGLDVAATLGLAYVHSSPAPPPNRFDEAMEAARSGKGDFLLRIQDYNLSDEQETRVLEALFEKNPSAYRILAGKKEASPSLCAKAVDIALGRKQDYLADNLHRFNLSEEKKLACVQKMTKLFPQDVAENISKYKLSREQEKEIAQALAREPLGKLSENLSKFSSLTPEDKKELALIAVKTNPTEVYENLSKYGLEDAGILEEDLALYFKMEKILNDLKTGEPVLEDALKCAQEITRKGALPRTFEKALNTEVEKRMAKATKSEAVELVHLINTYPSAITLPLVNRVHAKAKNLFPTLSEYCSVQEVHLPRGSLELYQTYHTKLNGKGFDVLTQKGPVPVAKTTYIEDLPSVVQKFIEDPKQKKLAIPVSFTPELVDHFCPLYLEKDERGEVRAFISDSLGEHSEQNFSDDIREKIKSQADVYVFEPQRQYGYNVCSVFTMDDIQEIGRYSDFFSVLEKEGDIETVSTESGSFKRVRSAPTGMMKMTQSMGKVQRLMKEKGETLIQGAAAEVTFNKFAADASHFDLDKTGSAKKQNKAAEWAMARNFEVLLSGLSEN